MRYYYCMDTYFIFIFCSLIREVHVDIFVLNSLPACHTNVNGSKPGSNLIMTDRHAAEFLETVWALIEPRCEKTGLAGAAPDQVRHKPGCTITENG